MSAEDDFHLPAPDSTNGQDRRIVPSKAMIVMSSGDKVLYPPPLTTHGNVITDRDLFFDTLNKFHAALGTRLMIPTIGGKELDLHLLYAEVTSRGGHDQVTKDRKWKEVTIVFNFPPTTTSASYVLRKNYISLLHHYEQVYFFGNKGELVAPPVPVSVPILDYQIGDNGFYHSGIEDKELILKQRKRKRLTIGPSHLCEVNPGALVGQMVTGVIDGKFDHGYLVTVTVGTEKLKGILYHMPSGSMTPQFASVLDMRADAGLILGTPKGQQRRRRRRKDEMPRRDPSAPKPNRSGYNFFFQEEHMRLKTLYPDKDKKISQMIGEEWNKLTEDKRSVYQKRAILDKERYKREMMEYRDRLKAHVDSGNDGLGIVQIVNSVELKLEGNDAGNDKVLGLRNAHYLEEEQVKVSNILLPGLTMRNEHN